MKKLILIAGTFVIASASANAANDVMMSYGETVVPLGSIAHFLEDATTIRTLVTADNPAGSVERTEAFRSMEVRAKIRVASLTPPGMGEGDVNYLLAKEDAEVVWEEDSRGTSAKLEPRVLTVKYDSTGKLEEPFVLADLPYVSLPVIIPHQPLSEGQLWSETQNVIIEQDIPMMLRTEYRLNRMGSLAGDKIAEITYRTSGEIKGTVMTDDPLFYAVVERLRARGIESIAVNGTGTMAFNLSKNFPAVYTIDLTIETTSRSLSSSQSEIVEDVRNLHKAEVMLSQ